MKTMQLNIQKFASGTISKTSSPSTGDIRILWSSTLNSNANTSSVTATVQIRATSGSAYCTFSGTVTIDGSSKSISKYRGSDDRWTTSWKDVGSYTKTVTHNENGTKTITISSTLTQAGTSMAGTYVATGSAVLDNNNRASVLGTIADFGIADTIDIPITKYVEAYSDTLVIKAGTTTIKTITSITNGYSLTFSAGEQTSIKALMTSPQIQLEFTLSTYDGATQIGSSSVKYATVTSLDKPILYNIKKKANGHYKVAINGIVDDDDVDPLQIYDDSGDKIPISGGGDMFRVVSYTFSSGTHSAGDKGYHYFSITIPTGYTSFIAQVSSNQIANLNGAQYTPAYNHIGTTGTQTVYVWYYYPTAVATARNIEYKLICIKTAYYNEVQEE